MHFKTQLEFILSPPSSVPPKYCLLFCHLQRSNKIPMTSLSEQDWSAE